MEIVELREVKKRKVPLFKVSVEEDSDYAILTTIPYVQEAVMNELIIAIKEGISKKRNKVSLFNISNTPYSLELEKDQWNISLKTVIKYHEAKEDYEKCVEIRDLILKLQ